MLQTRQIAKALNVSPDTARRRLEDLGVEGERRLGNPRAAKLYPADVLLAKLRERGLHGQAHQVERYVANLQEPA